MPYLGEPAGRRDTDFQREAVEGAQIGKALLDLTVAFA
jgi:hypothetical protein